MNDAKKWSDDLLALVSSPLSPQEQAECARSWIAFQRFGIDLVRQRMQEPQDDIASVLAAAQRDSDTPRTVEDLGLSLSGLLLAGHETTANLIGHMMRLLLDDRENWEMLLANPKLIPKAVEEALRFEPPSQAFIRTTTKEISIGGITIPQDAQLLLVFASTNHDETQFFNPDSFDVQRSPNNHLAFGLGAHKCVGAPIARLEGRIVLEIFLERIPDIRLVAGQTFEYMPTLLSRGLKQLYLEWGTV